MAVLHFLCPTSLTLVVVVLLGAAPIASTLAQVASSNEQVSEVPFLAENSAAMDKMMKDMAIKPTGDIDRDFVAMMVAHHQGAIDMAEALLLYGHNEQLRRLAQEIIVTQQQEITAMRLAVDEPLPPSMPAPDQASAAPPAMPADMMHIQQKP